MGNGIDVFLLSLFPGEYPIFADWLDHRLNV